MTPGVFGLYSGLLLIIDAALQVFVTKSADERTADLF
jgi:hypothetical protein